VGGEVPDDSWGRKEIREQMREKQTTKTGGERVDEMLLKDKLKSSGEIKKKKTKKGINGVSPSGAGKKKKPKKKGSTFRGRRPFYQEGNHPDGGLTGGEKNRPSWKTKGSGPERRAARRRPWR